MEAGTYMLGPWMTVPQIATMMVHGDVATASVTIPEGWDVAQVAAALANAGLGPTTAFLDAAQDPALVQTVHVSPALDAPYAVEGFLFPNTYQFQIGTSPMVVLGVMVHEFELQWTPSLETAASAEGLNTLQAVTLASIVQREVATPGQMRTVAGIYLNRLHRGMDLDADPTVLYGLGLISWQGPLGPEQLQSTSPYNTYMHAGLPPGPICNPGAAALNAVAHPDKVQALYFLSAPNGALVVANTYAEQLTNEQRYLGY